MYYQLYTNRLWRLMNCNCENKFFPVFYFACLFSPAGAQDVPFFVEKAESAWKSVKNFQVEGFAYASVGSSNKSKRVKEVLFNWSYDGTHHYMKAINSQTVNGEKKTTESDYFNNREWSLMYFQGHQAVLSKNHTNRYHVYTGLSLPGYQNILDLPDVLDLESLDNRFEYSMLPAVVNGSRMKLISKRSSAEIYLETDNEAGNLFNSLEVFYKGRLVQTNSVEYQKFNDIFFPVSSRSEKTGLIETMNFDSIRVNQDSLNLDIVVRAGSSFSNTETNKSIQSLPRDMTFYELINYDFGDVIVSDRTGETINPLGAAATPEIAQLQRDQNTTSPSTAFSFLLILGGVIFMISGVSIMILRKNS